MLTKLKHAKQLRSLFSIISQTVREAEASWRSVQCVEMKLTMTLAEMILWLLIFWPQTRSVYCEGQTHGRFEVNAIICPSFITRTDKQTDRQTDKDENATQTRERVRAEPSLQLGPAPTRTVTLQTRHAIDTTYQPAGQSDSTQPDAIRRCEF